MGRLSLHPRKITKLTRHKSKVQNNDDSREAQNKLAIFNKVRPGAKNPAGFTTLYRVINMI